MVNYECKLCNFKTHLKTDFKRHLNTLKHGRKMEENKTNPLEGAKKSQKRAKKSQKEPKRADESVKFLCYCGAHFKTFANKRRHELHRCKKIKHPEYSATTIENRELKKQRKIMLKQIDQLIQKAGNTTYNTQNNTNIKLNGFGKENLSFITDALKLN